MKGQVRVEQGRKEHLFDIPRANNTCQHLPSFSGGPCPSKELDLGWVGGWSSVQDPTAWAGGVVTGHRWPAPWIRLPPSGKI